MKSSVLVISEIIGLFVNTLTVDDKYSLCNSENLCKRNQMQLSKKQKSFSQFHAPFLKPASIFEHFEKEDDPHSLYISEFIKGA